MTEWIAELILTERNWMPAAMAIAFIAVAARLRTDRHTVPNRLRTLRALTLFYGVMIGIMASGHLIAVSIKAAQGTLQGSPWFLYTLGLALAVPAWWLACVALLAGLEDPRGLRRTVGLNGWLSLALMAIGPHNWPIAAPAVLNIAYRFQTQRAVGTVIVIAVGVGYVALFAGALLFMAGGQTFEELQGLARISHNLCDDDGFGGARGVDAGRVPVR